MTKELSLNNQRKKNDSLDFIGSARAVKDLFSLPYANDHGVNVAVHNMDGVLLLDVEHHQEDPVQEKSNHRKEMRDLVGVSSSVGQETEALTIVKNQLMEQQTPINPTEENQSQVDEIISNYIPRAPEPREYLSWKFHDMKMLVGTDALIVRNEQNQALAVRIEDAQQIKALAARHQEDLRTGRFTPDFRLTPLQQRGKPTYAEATTRPRVENARKEAISDDNHNNKNSSFAAPDLDSVRLQTCIVPLSHTPVGGLLPSGRLRSREQPSDNKSPVSAVLDAYLDNIMANVPQLALCLREKGFIQSVKLLQTHEIPFSFLATSTVDSSVPFDVINGDPSEQIFSPQIMEMNASALLRFLKNNCVKDNATYLLRREPGQTNIQLYDISSISAQRQRKWIWWLAMMSYRFANRLRSLSVTNAENVVRRKFRTRQRSLLENTLELLEMLADMDGNARESLVAAIRENLADTYLVDEEEEVEISTPSPVSTQLATSSQQPYGNISVDALNKSSDHLEMGIKSLRPVLDKTLVGAGHPKTSHKRDDSNVVVVSVNDEKESSDSEDEAEPTRYPSVPIDAVVTQLFGLHYKLVNISLRLAEIHLRNYYSSSAMQALRTAARRVADSVYFLQLLMKEDETDCRISDWLQRLRLQYTWLWEHCGHFARSFAADGLWRDRGHTSGDDVISVLQDAGAAFSEHKNFDPETKLSSEIFTIPGDPLTSKSSDMVNLHSLSAIVDINREGNEGIRHEGSIDAAIKLLSGQNLLIRDERKVLVAACIAYHRSIEAFSSFKEHLDVEELERLDGSLLSLLHQRLGDACNEIGKILLDQLKRLLAANPDGKSGDDAVSAAVPLLSSAEFWFFEGLTAFQNCHDLRNVALLRCNLCQCYKLRANAVFAFDESKRNTDSPTHAEVCLQEAARQLQSAHEFLGERDADPICWDMVSNELAATFLVLGVRRRQSLTGPGNLPILMQALRLSPGKERKIVEPMERALSIYEQAGNRHQAAATHYQLALFFSKIWTCQRDEVKTREKLSAAFRHFNAAYAFFSQVTRGNESTFCLLCIDLAGLYAAVSGEECLRKALLRYLDTAVVFSPESITDSFVGNSSRIALLEQMDTLATSVEDRTFKLLRNLAKLEEDNSTGVKIYKNLYRVGLRSKVTACDQSSCAQATGDDNVDTIVKKLCSVYKILTDLRDELSKSQEGTLEC